MARAEIVQQLLGEDDASARAVVPGVPSRRGRTAHLRETAPAAGGGSWKVVEELVVAGEVHTRRGSRRARIGRDRRGVAAGRRRNLEPAENIALQAEEAVGVFRVK